MIIMDFPTDLYPMTLILKPPFVLQEPILLHTGLMKSSSSSFRVTLIGKNCCSLRKAGLFFRNFGLASWDSVAFPGDPEIGDMTLKLSPLFSIPWDDKLKFLTLSTGDELVGRLQEYVDDRERMGGSFCLLKSTVPKVLACFRKCGWISSSNVFFAASDFMIRA